MITDRDIAIQHLRNATIMAERGLPPQGTTIALGSAIVRALLDIAAAIRSHQKGRHPRGRIKR